MRIAIFGGSFDPIHRGHAAIANAAIAKLNLDKLFFVPTAISEYKPDGAYVPGANRVEMITMVLPPKCEVSWFEIKRGGVSYTKDTVAYFAQKFPQAELFLIIGSDNLPSLHKWNAIGQIIKLSKLIVFHRTPHFALANAKRFDAIILDEPFYEYSSTNFHHGETAMVDPAVLAYIAKHYFYLEVITKNLMGAQNFIHAKAVAKQAIIYAKLLNYDINRAYIAGLIHDIAKHFSAEKTAFFLHKYGLAKVPPHLVHATLGAAWLRNEYKMQDEEIINAVMHHTTLALNLSPLDKIVFAADKLAIGRKFPGIQSLRAMIATDFNRGFAELVRQQSALIKTKTTIDPEQNAIFEKWGKG